MKDEAMSMGAWRRPIAAAAGLAALLVGAAEARAQGGPERGFDGAEVAVQVLVEDARETAPRFLGVVHRARVGPGREFELGDEPIQNGIYVVQGELDFDGARIVGTYERSTPGVFVRADFNGYVIVFEGACGVAAAEIDVEATNMLLEEEDVSIEGGALRINVSGRRYGPGVRFVVEATPAPCNVG